MNALYAAVGILFGLFLITSLRRPGPRWTSGSWFGFALVILPNLTLAIATLTGGYITTVDNYWNRVVQIVGPAATVNEYATPLLACIAVVCALVTLRRDTKVNVAAIVLALLLVVAGAAAALGGGALFTGGRISMLAIVVAVAFMPRSQSTFRGIAVGLATLLVGSLVATVIADHALQECDPRKCGAFGSLFTGLADNNNSFGMLAALAVPVLWLGLNAYNRSFAVLAVLLALASGSRTSQAAAFLALLACLILDKSSPVRRATVATSTAVAGALMIAVPFLGVSDDALTGRPTLWALAREYSAERPVFGYGPELWRSLVDIGVIQRAAGYATHNQAMEVLFVAGWVGVLLAATLIFVLFKQNKGARSQICLLLLPVFVCGIAERPWTFGGVDWMIWSLFAAVTFIKNGPPERDPEPATKSRVGALAS